MSGDTTHTHTHQPTENANYNLNGVHVYVQTIWETTRFLKSAGKQTWVYTVVLGTCVGG